MKRLMIVPFVMAFFFVACNNTSNTNKETETVETTSEEATKEEKASNEFKLSPSETQLQFVAYKTTDKAPVKGVFETLEFEERTNTDLSKLLNGLDFSIPVSSLFTNDATGTRDPKIKEFFFGKMVNAELLSGKILFEGGNYFAEISMNDVTNKVPLNVELLDGNFLSATTTINLGEWDALDALASLNEVCFDLHKGSDGVSKTWEDVTVEITSQL